MILILVAAVATGCGQAAAAGTRTPDAPTSHAVDPGEPPATGGGASWVTPVPGDGPSNPVHPIAIHTHLNGSSGVAVVTWWGGVAPCYVLRSVRVTHHDTTIRIAVREGAARLRGPPASRWHSSSAPASTWVIWRRDANRDRRLGALTPRRRRIVSSATASTSRSIIARVSGRSTHSATRSALWSRSASEAFGSSQSTHEIWVMCPSCAIAIEKLPRSVTRPARRPQHRRHAGCAPGLGQHRRTRTARLPARETGRRRHSCPSRSRTAPPGGAAQVVRPQVAMAGAQLLCRLE